MGRVGSSVDHSRALRGCGGWGMRGLGGGSCLVDAKSWDLKVRISLRVGGGWLHGSGTGLEVGGRVGVLLGQVEGDPTQPSVR